MTNPAPAADRSARIAARVQSFRATPNTGNAHRALTEAAARTLAMADELRQTAPEGREVHALLDLADHALAEALRATQKPLTDDERQAIGEALEDCVRDAPEAYIEDILDRELPDALRDQFPGEG